MPQTSEGAIKVNAQKANLTVEKYKHLISSGLKWCYHCKQWKPTAAFIRDRSRYDGLSPLCKTCRNSDNRIRYQPKQGPRKYGPSPKPARDGDKKQARQRINVEVRTGRRPHPNTLLCADCGHEWRPGERRHEYDHYLGYGAEHHYDVETVCTLCHRKRMTERGEINQTRSYLGRYASKGNMYNG